MGRNLTVEDEQPGQEPVVILSHDFWRRRFDADRNVIGKPLRLNDKTFTVIGVMPPEFKLSYPKPTELWTPLTFGPKERANWDEVAYKVVARLKPGVTIQIAGDQFRLYDTHHPCDFTILCVKEKGDQCTLVVKESISWDNKWSGTVVDT